MRPFFYLQNYPRFGGDERLQLVGVLRQVSSHTVR